MDSHRVINHTEFDIRGDFDGGAAGWFVETTCSMLVRFEFQGDGLSMSLYLEVISGLNEAQRYDLPPGETLIGRQADCQIVLPATTVSRRHAKLTFEGQTVTLQDLGSQNGTLLAGLPIDDAIVLNPGDQFVIDQFELRLLRRELSDTVPEPLTEFPRVIVPGASREMVISDVQSGRILVEIEVDTHSVSQVSLHAEQKLQAVLELVRHAESSLDLDVVVDNLITGLMRIFPLAERVGVFLLGESGEPYLKLLRHRNERTARLSGSEFSRTIHEMVLRETKVVLSQDLQQDDRFDGAASLVGAKIRSMMCAPLIAPSKGVLGVVQLDAFNDHGEFSPQDAQILASLATLTGLMVEAARAHEVELELSRRRLELRSAQTVQQNFLPDVAPQIPGYDIFMHYEAAEAVGGDYIDLLEIAPGKWALAIGDVSGKGMSAALFMARVSGQVRICAREGRTAGEIVTMLNQHVCQRILPGRFVTFALAILNTQDHVLSMACAGHIPPLRVSITAGICELMTIDDIAGPPLGLIDDWEFGERTLEIASGDHFLLITDGLSEAQSSSRELLGLKAIAESGRGVPTIDEWGRRLLNLVATHRGNQSPQDDLCLLGLGRHLDSKHSH